VTTNIAKLDALNRKLSREIEHYKASGDFKGCIGRLFVLLSAATGQECGDAYLVAVLNQIAGAIELEDGEARSRTVSNWPN
jgi:hypothetical protein